MVRHCNTLSVKILSIFILHIQPVNALGWQVQFMYPLEFDKVIWVMGPLHIEMVFISATRDWLEGSG